MDTVSSMLDVREKARQSIYDESSMSTANDNRTEDS